MSFIRPTVETILADAVEIASSEARQGFVAERCAGDDALRREVERLVACHFSAGRFLEPDTAESPTVMYSGIREAPGAQIGPYKLLEQIGEGGFGVVFMAEQAVPIRRRVALKILKPGMDTRQFIARFEAERQALALMDHLHIAKVLDAGATETGRPYFVMELVKGMPITRYCDEQRLAMRERLQLFIDVCGAIQHAHQKGIIHRDIKPNNVLVTLQDGRPIVKVIDFGVAKALGQQLTEKTVFTGFAQMVGTPLYMSPEQAALSNVDVDTRSDVYSLGVLLYELLTSSTPFTKESMSNVSYDELRRIIREDEPPRPSTRVSTMQADAQSTKASHLPVERQKLSHQLRGELDWIVMKALEKDRSRRYESASAFAADVERYLNDEPVQACPPSMAYRIRKSVRRNMVLLTTTALVLVALLAGTALATWHAIRAGAAQQQAEEKRRESERHLEAALLALEQLLAHVGNPDLAEIPQLQGTIEKVLEDSVMFYERFAEEHGTSPQLRYRAAGVLQRLALLAKDTFENPKAIEAFGKAVALADRLVEEAPDRKDYRELQAGVHRATGGFYVDFEVAKDAPDMALKHLQRAELLYHNLALSEPGNKQYLAQEADALLARAGVYRKRFPADPRGVELSKRAFDLFERSIPDWHSLKALADISAPTDPERADVLYRRSLSLFREGKPSKRRERHSHGWLLNDVANHFSRRDPAEADGLWKEAIPVLKDVARDYPTIPRHQNFLAAVVGQYVRFLVDQKQKDDARELLEELIAGFPDVPRLHFVHAELLGGAEEPDDAIMALTAALKSYSEVPEYYLWRGKAYSRSGNLDAAINDLNQAISLKLKRNDPAAYSLIDVFFFARSELHLARREFQLAIDDAESTISRRPTVNWPYKRRAQARFELGEFAGALDDLWTAHKMVPHDLSTIQWIPTSKLAACPDQAFREGFLKLVDEAVALNHGSINFRSLRATVLMEFGNRKAALPDLKIIAQSMQPASAQARCLWAMAALEGRDEALYRKLVSDIVQNPSKSEDFEDLHLAAWTAAIVPKALDDYEPAIMLARRALALSPTDGRARLAMIAVLYRAGRYDEAQAIQAQMGPGPGSPAMSPACLSLFRAMLLHQLGQADKTKGWFERATNERKKEFDNAAQPPSWQLRVTLQRLGDEAGRLINPPATGD